MNARILLVDDHEIVRDGLRHVIRKQTDLEVVGDAATATEVMPAVEKLRPNLIVMDIYLGNDDGIEISRQVLARFPSLKIIILSAYADAELVTAAIHAGVSGYLFKSNATAEILQAIRSVLAGKNYLCGDATTLLLANYKKITSPARNLKPDLSPREMEVLVLIAEGLRTKEIAEKLHLGVKTIETHRANLMEKLHCDSPVALAKYALREGITSL